MTLTKTTVAEVVAFLLANTTLAGGEHHETLKKAIRAKFGEAPSGDQLREVRAGLAAGRSGAPLQAEEPLVLHLGTPGGQDAPSEVGDWTPATVCTSCDGFGVRKDDPESYCGCAAGQRRQREEAGKNEPVPDRGPAGSQFRKLIEEREAASAERAKAGETNGSTNKEDGVTTATKVRQAKAKGKQVAKGGKDRDAEADLRKRYPHIREVIEWGPRGNPSRVKIECTLHLSSKCEKKREIFVQDLFQVKACKTCKEQQKKNDRAAARADRKPAKKAKAKKGK